MSTTERHVDRIRAEYLALPGLKLTREQACRLWAVNSETCDAAIDALVEEGFLQKTGTGKFIALPRRAGAAARIRELAAQVPPIRCPHCQKLNMQRERDSASSSTFRCIACGRIVSFTALSA